jgi:hypothetical protein
MTINKFVEKKMINGVDFIFFDQLGAPQAIFMYNGKFFWVRGHSTIERKLFNQIVSTFKFY